MNETTSTRVARRVPALLGGLVGLWLLAAGCVDTYSGTRMELTIQVDSQLDTGILVLPTPGLRPGDEGYFSHYEIHANIRDSGLVRLGAFLIQPVLHVNNPCLQFVPDDFCMDGPGYECAPYVNMERYSNLQDGVFGVVSIATSRPSDATDLEVGDWTGDATDYVQWPGYDFMRWPDRLFKDPSLGDPLLKLARDNLEQDEVEAFCDALPQGYYLGNGAQLTYPLHGSLFGVVDSADPRTGSRIGGITLWVPGKLHDMTEMIITRERDPKRISRVNPNNAARTDLLPGADGEVFLVGRADEVFGYLRRDMYRGVTRVQLEHPFGLGVTMNVIVFEDIDEDPIEL